MVMPKVKYRGKNKFDEFLSAATTISGKISKIEGVVGILATGGLGRGFCEDHSDIDLIVYADKDKVREIGKYIAVGVRYKGIDLDTPVVSYQMARDQKSPSRYWSQTMRWDRSNSSIMFDTRNRIRDMLKEKLVFPDSEQKRLLGKYRWAVEEYLVYNSETLERRGNLVNVSHALMHATENIILWIYAKNRRFQPYTPKWLFYHLENGFVPESRHMRTLQRPFLGPVKTVEQARAIRAELIGLCDKIGLRFKYRSVDEIFGTGDEKWGIASEKTKYYLSW